MSPNNKNSDIRHCHLYKRNDFEGYGFNLYKKTREELHTIGNLEPGSPGSNGGLRQDDVLIEVNGVNVEKIKHQDVVDKIRELPTAVSLLVIDKKTHAKMKKKFKKITSADKNVVLMYSEKINTITESEILEIKNNLKNVSDNRNDNENESKLEAESEVDGDRDGEVYDDGNVEVDNDGDDEVDDDGDGEVDGDGDVNDGEEYLEKRDNDFTDRNSMINETIGMVMEKRKHMEDKEIEVALEEVDSKEILADEAEEDILEAELDVNSEADMSYKTASSTGSIYSIGKDNSSEDSPPYTPSPTSDQDELLSLHLPGSAQEMKAIIERKKKIDSRMNSKFDLWQKHSIIQAL